MLASDHIGRNRMTDSGHRNLDVSSRTLRRCSLRGGLRRLLDGLTRSRGICIRLFFRRRISLRSSSGSNDALDVFSGDPSAGTGTFHLLQINVVLTGKSQHRRGITFFLRCIFFLRFGRLRFRLIQIGSSLSLRFRFFVCFDFADDVSDLQSFAFFPDKLGNRSRER
ncbi:hypothetical protein CHCC19467_2465 [Bacillus paralicheniformis]|nr:hypothetical protein CHCC19467_2465 [Bacillus paralicheniformis]